MRKYTILFGVSLIIFIMEMLILPGTALSLNFITRNNFISDDRNSYQQMETPYLIQLEKDELNAAQIRHYRTLRTLKQAFDPYFLLQFSTNSELYHKYQGWIATIEEMQDGIQQIEFITTNEMRFKFFIDVDSIAMDVPDEMSAVEKIEDKQICNYKVTLYAIGKQDNRKKKQKVRIYKLDIIKKKTNPYHLLSEELLSKGLASNPKPEPPLTEKSASGTSKKKSEWVAKFEKRDYLSAIEIFEKENDVKIINIRNESGELISKSEVKIAKMNYLNEIKALSAIIWFAQKKAPTITKNDKLLLNSMLLIGEEPSRFQKHLFPEDSNAREEQSDTFFCKALAFDLEKTRPAAAFFKYVQSYDNLLSLSVKSKRIEWKKLELFELIKHRWNSAELNNDKAKKNIIKYLGSVDIIIENNPIFIDDTLLDVSRLLKPLNAESQVNAFKDFSSLARENWPNNDELRRLFYFINNLNWKMEKTLYTDSAEITTESKHKFSNIILNEIFRKTNKIKKIKQRKELKYELYIADAEMSLGIGQLNSAIRSYVYAYLHATSEDKRRLILEAIQKKFPFEKFVPDAETEKRLQMKNFKEIYQKLINIMNSNSHN